RPRASRPGVSQCCHDRSSSNRRPSSGQKTAGSFSAFSPPPPLFLPDRIRQPNKVGVLLGHHSQRCHHRFHQQLDPFGQFGGKPLGHAAIHPSFPVRSLMNPNPEKPLRRIDQSESDPRHRRTDDVLSGIRISGVPFDQHPPDPPVGRSENGDAYHPSSSLDFFDLDLGEGLAMPFCPLVPFFRFKLENGDLLSFSVLFHFPRDGSPFDRRRSDHSSILLSEQQHLVEADDLPFLGGQLFDENDVPFLHAVLLAPRFNVRVHPRLTSFIETRQRRVEFPLKPALSGCLSGSASKDTRRKSYHRSGEMSNFRAQKTKQLQGKRGLLPSPLDEFRKGTIGVREGGLFMPLSTKEISVTEATAGGEKRLLWMSATRGVTPAITGRILNGWNMRMRRIQPGGRPYPRKIG